MTMSAVIMAHPSRRRFVAELNGQLDRQLDVVWDRRNDRWDCGRRSMLAHDPSASHHLVLQDDAVPCRDLIAGIEQACIVAQDGGHIGPLAFYVGRQRPVGVQAQAQTLINRARRAGSPWAQMEGPWWGVAIALPTAQIADMLAWCDNRPDIANYDKRIARYYASRGIDCWYSAPSLVDHREVSENPSLVQGRTGNRQAHWFIGAERSALDIQWATPPVRISPRHRYLPLSKGALVSLPDIADRTVTVIDPRGLEIRVVAGRPIPAHLREPYADVVQPRISPPERQARPDGDEFASLRRPELLRLAKERGVPGKGTNVDLIASLRAAG